MDDKTAFYNSKLGILSIGYDDSSIISIRINPTGSPAINNEPGKISDFAFKQISEYLEGRRREFTFPFALEGTDFQIDVWNILLNIPYGETTSFYSIACKVGNSKYARAVGNAIHANKLLLVVPCHRVIGKNGDLAGYVAGSEIKKLLLDLELRNSGKKTRPESGFSRFDV